VLLHELSTFEGIECAVEAVPLLPAVPALLVVGEVPVPLNRGVGGPGNELLDL
jgi:hypothetical protein